MAAREISTLGTLAGLWPALCHVSGASVCMIYITYRGDGDISVRCSMYLYRIHRRNNTIASKNALLGTLGEHRLVSEQTLLSRETLLIVKSPSDRLPRSWWCCSGTGGGAPLPMLVLRIPGGRMPMSALAPLRRRVVTEYHWPRLTAISAARF